MTEKGDFRAGITFIIGLTKVIPHGENRPVQEGRSGAVATVISVQKRGKTATLPHLERGRGEGGSNLRLPNRHVQFPPPEGEGQGGGTPATTSAPLQPPPSGGRLFPALRYSPLPSRCSLSLLLSAGCEMPSMREAMLWLLSERRIASVTSWSTAALRVGMSGQE